MGKNGGDGVSKPACTRGVFGFGSLAGDLSMVTYIVSNGQSKHHNTPFEEETFCCPSFGRRSY